MKSVHMAVLITFLFTIASAGTFTLQNSTVVAVKTTNQLSTTQVRVGQEIIFIVAADVKVDGEVLIKAGAPAYGIVQDSKNQQMAGIAGSIVVSVNSTVAVDGTTIALSGAFSNAGESEVGTTVAVGVILCPLALLNKGDAGIIPVGAQIRTMTVGSYDIETG